MKTSFDNYAELASSGFSNYVVSGRYKAHAESEPYMLRDILGKLDLKPSDRFLEIGCGPGNILIPLSFFVREAVGIDNANVINLLNKRFADSKCQYIEADFFDYNPKVGEAYDKILINSVISTLKNADDAKAFIDKASSLLAPSGRLLISDIANVNKRQRFLSTKQGQQFDHQWRKTVKENFDFKEEEKARDVLKQAGQQFQPDDDFIFEILKFYRALKWDSVVLPQNPKLPFGNTREDILLIRPAE